MLIIYPPFYPDLCLSNIYKFDICIFNYFIWVIESFVGVKSYNEFIFDPDFSGDIGNDF
jgi:hypothetical protein